MWKKPRRTKTVFLLMRVCNRLHTNPSTMNQSVSTTKHPAVDRKKKKRKRRERGYVSKRRKGQPCKSCGHSLDLHGEDCNVNFVSCLCSTPFSSEGVSTSPNTGQFKKISCAWAMNCSLLT